MEDLPLVAISPEAQRLAEALLAQGAVPAGSEEDALHIGIAAAAGIDFLLTWNFKHINNARTKAAITTVVEAHGLVCPALCSPEEFRSRNMNEDPIVAEIRRYRAEHAERYGHDLGRICQALREAEAKTGRQVVHRKPRLLLPKPGRSPSAPLDCCAATAARHPAN